MVKQNVVQAEDDDGIYYTQCSRIKLGRIDVGLRFFVPNCIFNRSQTLFYVIIVSTPGEDFVKLFYANQKDAGAQRLAKNWLFNFTYDRNSLFEFRQNLPNSCATRHKKREKVKNVDEIGTCKSKTPKCINTSEFTWQQQSQ